MWISELQESKQQQLKIKADRQNVLLLDAHPSLFLQMGKLPCITQKICLEVKAIVESFVDPGILLTQAKDSLQKSGFSWSPAQNQKPIRMPS